LCASFCFSIIRVPSFLSAFCSFLSPSSLGSHSSLVVCLSFRSSLCLTPFFFSCPPFLALPTYSILLLFRLPHLLADYGRTICLASAVTLPTPGSRSPCLLSFPRLASLSASSVYSLLFLIPSSICLVASPASCIYAPGFRFWPERCTELGPLTGIRSAAAVSRNTNTAMWIVFFLRVAAFHYPAGLLPSSLMIPDLPLSEARGADSLSSPAIGSSSFLSFLLSLCLAFPVLLPARSSPSP